MSGRRRGLRGIATAAPTARLVRRISGSGARNDERRCCVRLVLGSANVLYQGARVVHHAACGRGSAGREDTGVRPDRLLDVK
eukprot:scaffold3808_cov112-Isochrysis_galbana.AAC.49